DDFDFLARTAGKTGRAIGRIRAADRALSGPRERPIVLDRDDVRLGARARGGDDAPLAIVDPNVVAKISGHGADLEAWDGPIVASAVAPQLQRRPIRFAPQTI